MAQRGRLWDSRPHRYRLVLCLTSQAGTRVYTPELADLVHTRLGLDEPPDPLVCKCKDILKYCSAPLLKQTQHAALSTTLTGCWTLRYVVLGGLYGWD